MKTCLTCNQTGIWIESGLSFCNFFGGSGAEDYEPESLHQAEKGAMLIIEGL